MEELFGSVFDDAANNVVEENLTYDILQEQARLIKAKTIRIFTFKYCELFPVYMYVDEGIREELKLPKEIKIESNQALKDVFAKIFKSKKLSSIITKMMNEPKYDEKALCFLKDNGASTVSEIAKGIGVSIATMNKIIKELESSGKISKNEKNKWILKYNKES